MQSVPKACSTSLRRECHPYHKASLELVIDGKGIEVNRDSDQRFRIVEIGRRSVRYAQHQDFEPKEKIRPQSWP